MGTLDEDQCTFRITSHSFIHKTENISVEFVPKKKAAHKFCSIIFFSENCAVYEIMWKNTVEPDRPQVTI